jgi:hypothetical protein
MVETGGWMSGLKRRRVKMKRCIQSVSIAALVVGMTSGAMAASDVKKVEPAVSGAAHRASAGYHKQAKDYHLRKARREAKKGHYNEAERQQVKASRQAYAQHMQRHEARVQEKALRHD